MVGCFVSTRILLVLHKSQITQPPAEQEENEDNWKCIPEKSRVHDVLLVHQNPINSLAWRLHVPSSPLAVSLLPYDVLY